ncbi:glycoside hydrolase family 127 protein [Actinocrinis sp.]|uniref:glycoside hydrolase family 127 protein n=1 Tax=Actinocrinis sp. TaxID=1920516 RepID=UPI0039C8A43B
MSLLESREPSVASRPQSTPAHRAGPLQPTADARCALRPVGRSRITGGFWGEWRRINAEVCVPQGPALLEAAGNLHNLRLAAGQAEGEYRGVHPFLDTDVYKWLEAAAWQAADTDAAPELDAMISLIAAAQQPDGYLNSWFQVVKGGERYRDLRWGHELYCAGHLIQAGIALHRTTGRAELLAIARRFADQIDSTFGPGNAVDGVCGHPEVETALVELYRETGEPRYLSLARYFVDRRGYGLLAAKDRRAAEAGPAYCQDHVPVREATEVAGHAVRQLYLLAGVADVAAEADDSELRAAAERLWAEMVARKTYVTGGLGAHHDEEDFGDPYELPNERAYCETCAAVASVQWSWRMALMTGQAKYSDLVERTLYNAVLAGVSLDGERWLYVNPLQVRDGYRHPDGDHGVRRVAWFRCACCPPNVMRLLASLPHYFASADDCGLQLHQYATGRFGDESAQGAFAVRVVTDYPWNGRISIVVDECPAKATPWTLSLRIPFWCNGFRLVIEGEPTEAVPEDGWLRLRRAWRPGDALELELSLEPRLAVADPRVDSVRGCVAIERGPLVYCVEGVDHPGGGLDDLLFDPAPGLTEKHDPTLLGGVTVLHGSGRRRGTTALDGARGGGDGAASWWPYRSLGRVIRAKARADAGIAAAEQFELTAIPYYAWANREDGPMRVWLPTS